MTKTMLMNKPEAYNKAEILNLSLMTDELNTNSTIAIADFQNNDNQAVANSPIMIGELRNASRWVWPHTKPQPKCQRNCGKPCRTLRN